MSYLNLLKTEKAFYMIQDVASSFLNLQTFTLVRLHRRQNEEDAFAFLFNKIAGTHLSVLNDIPLNLLL